MPLPIVTPSNPTATSLPTPTGTRVVDLDVYQTSTTQGAQRATSRARLTATTIAKLAIQPAPAGLTKSFTRNSRLVLAHYFAWYDGNGWDNCNISAGDKPLAPYHSDDSAAIARHIQLAQETGLNGFTLHWFAPGDRTDQNFSTLLAQSTGQNFFSTVVFSHHIWPGVAAHNQQTIGNALRYIVDQHSGHPNFLRSENKPVIFFTDVYRTPATGESPPQFWAAVREQVDPQHQTLWIAEGLDASYLSVFDGLYVFKISHAAQPHDYLKMSRWGNSVRAWEEQTGQNKLWIATISPGWDDLRSGCRLDVRMPNTPHRLERAGGAIYQASFDAALASNPDWLILSSFNEWVEGSYIEPSVFYGDQYMVMTKTFVQRFQQK
jgi:hypothetical protein